MVIDQRDGMERRRDEISDPITLGEVYRLLLSVDARTKQIQTDADTESHSLRSRIGKQDIQIALFERDLQNCTSDFGKEIKALKDAKSEWRQWVAAVVVGAVVMLLQFLITRGGIH